SGFVPDPESLRRLKGALLVDRVEEKEDHVLVYITELTKNIAINHSLDLLQELPVQNLKPAVVKIYDYYQPKYIYPCAAGSLLSAGLILRSSPLGLPPRALPAPPCSSPHHPCLACPSVLRARVPWRPPLPPHLFPSPLREPSIKPPSL
ncbi:pregnancy zone protein-like, partial [Micropterus dolomieu]|uniref:pregnancy zone protein-like n=1 Tax=Micropterus dolomieu TaxID=147949 RepID=UPI001E8CE52F